MDLKICLLAISILAFCQVTYAVDRKQMNQSINISYGLVESVDRVKIDSKAGQNAVVGGVIGAATGGHHHRGESAAIGALAGGILTAMLEGKHKAYSYRIKTMSGGEKIVITEQAGIRAGDCVSLEEGATTNIRRVATVHCEYHGHAVMYEPMVHAKAYGSAAECHAAKAMVMQADNEAEMDMALKRVRIFCD